MAGGWRAGALACLVVLAVPSAAFGYGVSSPQAQRVTMADGVELAVDVYAPTDPATGQPASGAFPSSCR